MHLNIVVIVMYFVARVMLFFLIDDFHAVRIAIVKRVVPIAVMRAVYKSAYSHNYYQHTAIVPFHNQP